jgi:hypothetical protein
MRNQSASIGAPASTISRPASWRRSEPRPSAAMTSLARTSPVRPSAVFVRTPTTVPEFVMSPVASVSMRRSKPGRRAPSFARKFRKSHCGISAMYFSLTGKWLKSAIVMRSSPNWAERRGTFWCGSVRKRSSRPSSFMISSVDGCTVSPRKSRRKSPCFSRIVTGTPARASSRPATMPAGPPPTMMTGVNLSHNNLRSCRAKSRHPSAVALRRGASRLRSMRTGILLSCPAPPGGGARSNRASGMSSRIREQKCLRQTSLSLSGPIVKLFDAIPCWTRVISSVSSALT